MNTAALPEKCGLSPGLRRCFNVIEKHINETGSSPSYEEIMRKLGLNSKGNVNRMVNDLQARGWITFTPGLKRSIALVEASAPSYALSAELDAALRQHCRMYGTDPTTVFAYAVKQYLRGSFGRAAA